jgi:hypothetical protein
LDAALALCDADFVKKNVDIPKLVKEDQTFLTCWNGVVAQFSQSGLSDFFDACFSDYGPIEYYLLDPMADAGFKVEKSIPLVKRFFSFLSVSLGQAIRKHNDYDTSLSLLWTQSWKTVRRLI